MSMMPPDPDSKTYAPLGNWHIGRRWYGPDHLSFDCNCPKTPCGLTTFGNWDPECEFHGLSKSIRQGHPPEECPGHEVWCPDETPGGAV